MTTHEIIVLVLRRHLITRKIAQQIADEITAEMESKKNGTPQPPKEVK